jgi:hypothetical protein
VENEKNPEGSVVEFPKLGYKAFLKKSQYHDGNKLLNWIIYSPETEEMVGRLWENGKMWVKGEHERTATELFGGKDRLEDFRGGLEQAVMYVWLKRKGRPLKKENNEQSLEAVRKCVRTALFEAKNWKGFSIGDFAKDVAQNILHREKVVKFPKIGNWKAKKASGNKSFWHIYNSEGNETGFYDAKTGSLWADEIEKVNMEFSSLESAVMYLYLQYAKIHAGNPKAIREVVTSDVLLKNSEKAMYKAANRLPSEGTKKDAWLVRFPKIGNWFAERAAGSKDAWHIFDSTGEQTGHYDAGMRLAMDIDTGRVDDKDFDNLESAVMYLYLQHVAKKMKQPKNTNEVNEGGDENKETDLLPQDIIDMFYDRVKERLDMGAHKEHPSVKRELDRIIKLNGRIPDMIKALLG